MQHGSTTAKLWALRNSLFWSHKLCFCVFARYLIHLFFQCVDLSNVILTGQNLSPNERTEYGYLVGPGETVVLNCSFASTTKPQFNWRLSTYDTVRYLNTSDPTGVSLTSALTRWTSELRIESFNYSDVGNYSCSATNDIESGRRFVVLSLHGNNNFCLNVVRSHWSINN